jgi:hypothetical protein
MLPDTDYVRLTGRTGQEAVVTYIKVLPQLMSVKIEKNAIR